MGSDLYPERPVRRAGPLLTGRVVRLLEGYPREMKIRQPVLVAVLTTATVARVILLMLASVLRAGAGSQARRRWKELRKGPEFLVTPLRIRDATGVLYEVEVHGHLPQSALHPADHIQATVRPQKDPELPSKVERIVNITTGQLLTPRPPTLWSHIGPALLLQAVIGLLLVGVIAAVLVTD